MMSLESWHCPYYHEINSSQSSFVDVTWKFGLPLLSWAEMFAKIGPFWGCHLKIGTAPIVTRYTFPKIKQFYWCDLKIWPAPIITSWNICKNKAVLMMSLENWHCPYYHEVNFPKIKQFCWCHFKIWPAPIYHELKILQKTRQFWLSNLKI